MYDVRPGDSELEIALLKRESARGEANGCLRQSRRTGSPLMTLPPSASSLGYSVRRTIDHSPPKGHRNETWIVEVFSLPAAALATSTSALSPRSFSTRLRRTHSSRQTRDQSKPPKITPEMVDQAAILAGIGPFTDGQKKMMIDGLIDQNGSFKAIRKLKLPEFHAAPAYAYSIRLLLREMLRALPPRHRL